MDFPKDMDPLKMLDAIREELLKYQNEDGSYRLEMLTVRIALNFAANQIERAAKDYEDKDR